MNGQMTPPDLLTQEAQFVKFGASPCCAGEARERPFPFGFQLKLITRVRVQKRILSAIVLRRSYMAGLYVKESESLRMPFFDHFAI